MTANSYLCRRCRTPLQGDSLLCVACYRKLMRPCAACMDQWKNGQWVVRKDRKTKRPVDCRVCNNERYVLADYD